MWKPESYICPACGRGFRWAAPLRDHLAAVHTIVARDMRPWRSSALQQKGSSNGAAREDSHGTP